MSSRAGPVLIDGGFGTELERQGVSTATSLWSARALVDAPDAVRRVHALYYAAGAEVAITASYQVRVVVRGRVCVCVCGGGGGSTV